MNFSKLSLKVKLTVGFLLAGLIPAVTISTITFFKNADALREEAKSRLIAIRESKATEIENLFLTMKGQAVSLAKNKTTADAMKQFETAFSNFSKDSQFKKDTENANETLRNFYVSQFGNKYTKINPGKSFDKLNSTYGSLSKNQKLIQHAFISNNPNPLGEKDKLFKLNDGSEYSEAHKKFHDTFRSYLTEFGYYDIFLVSAETNEIIYSVYKELDFATNLMTGPYSNSSLGDVFQKAVNMPEGSYVISDIKKYLPSYDSPAAFIGAPVYEGSKKLGVLIFQIPVAKLNNILTSQRKWKESGLGDSGEIFLIGQDKRMRSISRFMAEDKEGFLNAMKTQGLSQDELNYMRSQETTALTATINTAGADEVTTKGAGFKIFEDYRGVNVLSAYKPLQIEGLNWYIMSEMDENEALHSVYALEKLIFIILSASLVIIFFASLFLSRGLANSIVNLSNQLRKVAEDVLKAANNIATSSEDLSSATTEQAASLQETSASVSEISAMVVRNSESAAQASTFSDESIKKASAGKDSVEEVKGAIHDIHENNNSITESVSQNNREIEEIIKVIEEISEKTKVINDIVFQTKLLAFNASVEAARAGEQGKGFSVVAEEVGNLAQMSGQAAGEISELLESSTGKVKSIVQQSTSKMEQITNEGKSKVEYGIKIASEFDVVLSEILDSFANVNNSVKEIASSSNEQALGVQEITTAVQQLDQVTQQNTVVANKSADDASALKQQSNSLWKLVEQMQALVIGDKGKAPEHSLDLASHSNESNRPTIARLSSKSKNTTPKPGHKAQPQSRTSTTVKPVAKKTQPDSHSVPDADDPRFEDVA